MKLPINIVMLTPGFARDEADTTAIPALQLYFRFLKLHFNDLNLNILTFQYPFKSGKYFWNGIPVYSAGGKNKFMNRLIIWFRILLQLFIIHRKKRIDLIHSFWLSETTLIGMIFSWFSGVPLISTAMGQDVKPSNKYLHILRFFNLNVVLISRFQNSFLPPAKRLSILKIIPFGIDSSLFKKEPSERTIDIIGVGSLNIVKNYADFVEIISLISKTFPGINCKIVGEGVMKESLENLVMEKNLSGNIIFSGNLNYKKTMTEMQSARILLHTSKFEGQALVITEALAAGLYVVSYPVGIAASLASPKLLTGETLEVLALHVSDILQNPEPDYLPEIHYKIEDTCKSNFTIYQSLVKS